MGWPEWSQRATTPHPASPRLVVCTASEASVIVVLERTRRAPCQRGRFAGSFRLARPVKAVVDCGNVTGSAVAVELLEAIGVDVIPLYCESDGTSPNHHPDPTVDENVQDMIGAVRAHGADLGIGFDGEADRIGVVDDRGDIIRGDVLLLRFALDLLKRRGPGETLVFDVKCWQVLPEEFVRARRPRHVGRPATPSSRKRFRETGRSSPASVPAASASPTNTSGWWRPPRNRSPERPRHPRATYRPRRGASKSRKRRSSTSSSVPSHTSAPATRWSRWTASASSSATGGACVRGEQQPVIVARYEGEDGAATAGIRDVMEGWLRGEGVGV